LAVITTGLINERHVLKLNYLVLWRVPQGTIFDCFQLGMRGAIFLVHPKLYGVQVN